MNLSDLLVFNNIVIQCHDNPDADAIASGYAVYTYLRDHGKNGRFIYSGKNRISKSNLVYLVETMDIPIEFESEGIGNPELLLMVDCQYGEGNVTSFPARKVAIIDHHQVAKGKILPEMFEIQSGYGSCCTIIWDMMRKEGYEPSNMVSTAMYYGLFTDTNALSEISHPLDRDMLDQIHFDKALIRRLNGMNITLEEAKIAGIALLGVEFHPENRYAILEAQPCDPNILGLISDFFLSVDTVDVCLVYSVLDYGVKFSVRSDTPEVRADEFAAYIARGIGSGGGHMDKAGGFLQNELLKQNYESYANASEKERVAAVTPILREKMHNYYVDMDIIYCGKTKVNRRGAKEYVKLPIKQGYAIPSEFLPMGQKILVRSLEGDKELKVEKDTVIMIGIKGEVWWTNTKKFSEAYKKLRGNYNFKLDYSPTIKDISTTETIDLIPHAHMCMSNGGSRIMAKPLTNETKIFQKGSKLEYFKGYPGDMMAWRTTDPDDMYIIRKDIFEQSYELAK